MMLTALLGKPFALSLRHRFALHAMSTMVVHWAKHHHLQFVGKREGFGGNGCR
jgi:hypothetical protein